MEDSKKQQLSAIHWTGIVVFVGIVSLVVLEKSCSSNSFHVEAQDQVSSAVKVQEAPATSKKVEIVKLLDEIGIKISDTSENKAIAYMKSLKVSESEAPAYKSIFKTSHEAFMSLPNADKDKNAYFIQRRAHRNMASNIL